ncbi:MAG TPA: DNA methyltransferase [Caldilineaceae bacterium]|nr:DNA methyltransferase [Caldilineaceae bacterium]
MKKPKATSTSSFGVSKREGHDASAFYRRNLYQNGAAEPEANPAPPLADPSAPERTTWVDRVFCQSAETMQPLPDQSVGLAFTSPPYNVGKSYDDDMSMESYLALIRNVAHEVYRVLLPGGRFVVNIANLGRKPYIPLHMHFYEIHCAVGFLPMGEIIWRKAKGASGNCAWGSWQSAKAPRLRDIHEYLLVFAKGAFSRPDRGESDITRDEFMNATLSIWEIPPESAKRVGHPAPFPVTLAERVMRLYSYVGDTVLDPFLGSGSTAVAAIQTRRHFVGFETDETYCQLAEQRIRDALDKQNDENVNENVDKNVDENVDKNVDENISEKA